VVVGQLVGAAVLQSRRQGGLQQVVGAVAVAGDRVGDHQVGEPVDVARRLQHHLRRHRGALQLQHALLQHKVGPPQLGHVLLDGAARGAVVVQARDGAVDLERRQVEQPALERVGDGGAEDLGGRGLGGGAALFRARVAAARGREVGLVGLFLVELEVLELGDGRVDLVLER
jgi:hypothetical protein